MEKKYTRDQIKDAIWQELKESDYAGENNDRAYEVIGIVMAGVDKIIVGDEQPGAVWLKDQYDKLYDQVKGGKRTVCYVDYHWGSKGEHEPMRDICTVTSDIFEFNARGTGYGYPRSRFDKTRDEKESFIDLCESMNVEWLCEGTAAAGREEDAGFRETIEDIILSAGKHNQEQCSEIADAILRDLSIGLRYQKKKSLSGEREEDAASKEVIDFIRDIATNWDCDSDGHKYDTGCRKCEAKKLYELFKQKEKL